MCYFNIEHITTYQYDYDVYNVKNLIKIFPNSDDYQKIISQNVTITGDPKVNINTDIFGNKLGVFILNGPIRELKITSSLVVQTFYKNILDEIKSASDIQWADFNILSLDTTFKLFLNPINFYMIWDINNVVFSYTPINKKPIDIILELNSYVYNNFRYDVYATNVYTSLLDVWNMKAGVCQDFAHILIYMLQLLNIPARYVCGYICPNENGLIGEGATHAWVEAYLPNFGWLGLDPTNNCLAQDKHVKVAVGRHFDDVSPVKGEFTGPANQFMNATVRASYEESLVC